MVNNLLSLNIYGLNIWNGADPKKKVRAVELSKEEIVKRWFEEKKFKLVKKKQPGFNDIGFDVWDPEEGNDYGDQQEERKKNAA